jgi:hypothetical protein
MHLTRLNLSHQPNISDMTLCKMAHPHSPKLKSLTISGCNGITTQGVMALGGDRIGWIGMSPCPIHVDFKVVCSRASWKVIERTQASMFHRSLMRGESWSVY